MQGDVNAAVFVNPQGVEMLGSSRGVPVANWHVAVILPTREAFAPIEALQLRMVLLTLLVSLLAAALTWWMMRRQLAPLLATVKTLASVSATNRPPQPLPVTTRDEIGELIGSFNALLATLGQREEALRQSEESLAITLHSIADGVIATDAQGRITRMNAAAERLTGWPLSEAMGRDLPVVFNAINAFSTDLSIHPVQPVADRDHNLGRLGQPHGLAGQGRRGVPDYRQYRAHFGRQRAHGGRGAGVQRCDRAVPGASGPAGE
jgi:PAS domain-containing protein